MNRQARKRENLAACGETVLRTASGGHNGAATAGLPLSAGARRPAEDTPASGNMWGNGQVMVTQRSPVPAGRFPDPVKSMPNGGHLQYPGSGSAPEQRGDRHRPDPLWQVGETRHDTAVNRALWASYLGRSRGALQVTSGGRHTRFDVRGRMVSGSWTGPDGFPDRAPS